MPDVFDKVRAQLRPEAEAEAPDVADQDEGDEEAGGEKPPTAGELAALGGPDNYATRNVGRRAIFDRATGERVEGEPSDDELNKGIAEGRFGVDTADGPVLVKKLGTKGTAGLPEVYKWDPTKLQAAIASGKYQLLNEQEELQHRVNKEEDAKGVGGIAANFAEGAANEFAKGMSFDVINPQELANESFTPWDREEEEAREKYHKWDRLFGGVLGLAASLKVGEPALKKIEEASEAARDMVFPAEELAHAGLGQQYAAKALQFAAEGAMLSAPKALIQATYGKNPPKAIETMAWGIGASAVVGLAAEGLAKAIEGARGAVEGATGVRLPHLPTADREEAEEGAEAAKEGEPALEEQGETVLPPEGAEADVKAAENAAAMPETPEQAAARRVAEVEKNPPLVEKPMAPTAQFSGDWAHKLGPKTLGAQKYQLAKLKPEWRNEITDYAYANGLFKPGMTREEVGKAAAELHEKNGDAIDAVEKLLDGAVEKGGGTVAKYGLKKTELGDAISAAFDTPMLRAPMNRDQAAAFDSVVQSANMLPSKVIDGQEYVPFSVAQDFVHDLRSKWVNSVQRALNEGGVRGPEVVTPVDKFKSAAYEVARTTLNKAADRTAAASADSRLVGALAQAKNNYAYTAEITKWARNLDAMQAGNKLVSLTDTINLQGGLAGGAVRAIGAGIGAAVGGPAGAIIGGSAASKPAAMAADFLAKRWMEDKGLVRLSALAGKYAYRGRVAAAAEQAATYGGNLGALVDLAKDTAKEVAKGQVIDQGPEVTGLRLAEEGVEAAEEGGTLAEVAERKRLAKQRRSVGREGAEQAALQVDPSQVAPNPPQVGHYDPMVAVMAHEGENRLGATLDLVKDAMKDMARGQIAEGGEETDEGIIARLLGSKAERAGLSLEQQLSRALMRIQQLHGSPEVLTQLIGHVMSPVHGAHRELGEGTSQKLAQIVQYLGETQPKNPATPGPFEPHEWEPSPSEIQEFADRVDVATNPMAAVRAMQNGTLSDAHMQTLQQLWPTVYELQKQAILEFHAEHPDVELEPHQRDAVNKFLTPDQQTEWAPALALLQQQYENPPAQSNAKSGTKRKPKGIGKGKKGLPDMGTEFSQTLEPVSKVK